MRRAVGKKWTESITSTKVTKAKKINLLLWGRPGSGKTTFIGTAKKVFILNFEQGILALGGQDLPHYTFKHDEKVYDTIMQIIMSARKKEDGFDKIETIALDSVWKLNQMLIDEICDEENISAPRIQDWGTLRNRIGNIINALMSLDYHFIATLGETVKVDHETEKSFIDFNMNGGYASQIDYEFNFVFYLEAVTIGPTTTYVAHTKPNKGHKAKTQVKLLPKITDPNFEKIWTEVQKLA